MEGRVLEEEPRQYGAGGWEPGWGPSRDLGGEPRWGPGWEPGYFQGQRASLSSVSGPAPGLTYFAGGAGPPWAGLLGHGAGSERESERSWLALPGQLPDLAG